MEKLKTDLCSGCSSNNNSGGSRILKRGGGNDISKVDLRILDSGEGEALEG